MAKKAALVFGIVFIIAALVGFFQNPLIGIFDVTTIHSVVHLLGGIVLLLVAISAPAKSAAALKWVGVIYLIVAVVGFFSGSFLGIFPVNDADNWLHIVLGIVIAAFGWAAPKGGMMQSSAPQM